MIFKTVCLYVVYVLIVPQCVAVLQGRECHLLHHVLLGTRLTGWAAAGALLRAAAGAEGTSLVKEKGVVMVEEMMLEVVDKEVEAEADKYCEVFEEGTVEEVVVKVEADEVGKY